MTGIFSPGKLMLTSEYFAIDGALVLAVPTRLGQEFFFEEKDDQKCLVFWEAYHQNTLWLKAVIDYKNWQILETNIPSSAEFILKTLHNVQQLSEIKFQHTNSYYLNTISLGGSGYDIAVAKEKSAILYQSKPEIKYEKVNFSPSFKNELIFIHLNQKQDSREGINLYRSKEKSQRLVDEFSNLTRNILLCNELQIFSQLMLEHEQKIANFLKIPTVKERFFADSPVFVKSLGAWGGDFVMSAKFDGFRDYFWGKGFSTIFDWDDLISL